MLRTCCLCLFFTFVYYAHSQQPVLQWAKQFGAIDFSNTGNNNGRSIAVDAQGNVYSAGVFFNTVDFDPGPGVYTLTAPGQGIYISKLNTSGDLVWAKQLPLGVSGPVDLTLDEQANVYITSYISTPVDMDPGAGVYIPAMVGLQDAFVLKLDTNGNFLWEKQFGGAGTANAAAGYALDIDPGGNVVVCGSFYGTVDFDPGIGSYLLSGMGTSEVFIVKLTATGNFMWASQLGHFATPYGYVDAEDLKCDNSGNVYTTGWFGWTCDFDPGPATAGLTAGGPGDGFVCKLDGNGNFVWVKKLGNSAGNEVVQPRGIDIDAQNNVYTTGSFLGIQDFDPGTGVYNLASHGGFDAYILKLNPAGDMVWARDIGGVDADYSFDVAVDRGSNVYITGAFSKMVDFDPGPNSYQLDLYDDAAVVKLDANGNFVFAAPFLPVGYALSNGRRLVADAAQNVYVTGYFGGSVDFDPGPGKVTLNSEPNGWDIFVVKLAWCLNQTTATINTSACKAYTLNNLTYDTSGTYTQVIPNASGCDSIITLHLTINKKVMKQTKTICEGEFFFAGGANQTVSGTYADTLQTVLGCDSIVTTTLVVTPGPKPNLGPDRNLCADSSLTLRPGQFAAYQWQDGSTAPSIVVNNSGQYSVSVIDSNNCVANASVTITRIPLPANFLKPADSICSYDKLLLQPLQRFSTYLWSTGAAQSQISITTPGQYWLMVSNRDGCYGTDTVTVYSKQCMQGFYAPSAFTPNGDGKNDSFKPLLFGKVKLYRFTVYNRWGQVVFQSTEVQKGWNGTVAGVLQQNDVFVWTCEYQFEGEAAKIEKGSIAIIR